MFARHKDPCRPAKKIRVTLEYALRRPQVKASPRLEDTEYAANYEMIVTHEARWTTTVIV